MGGLRQGRARRRAAAALAALAALALALPDQAAAADPGSAAADLLVLEGGDDPARFRWTDLPGGARCLAWPGGALVLDAGCAPREYGRDGYALDCGPLAAAGPAGPLALSEGEWTLREPLVLAAPGLRFWAARGQVELKDRRLLYRDRAGGRAAMDTRSSLVLLAGVALVTLTLLARARRRLQAR